MAKDIDKETGMTWDFYQRAYDVVEEKLTEALIILQEENGIDDGGCDPLAENQYNEELEDMVEAVRILLENQKRWNVLNGKGA